jgi:4-amino-4-deoxy-L-arabinose transferase-like glycosyltransferase
VTLGFAYLVGREILPIRLAAAVPMTMTGVPMFTSVSSAISADPLANLLSAALLLVCVRRANAPGGESHRWPVAAGALLGLGLLTKLALAIFLPIALLVLLWRAARPMREASLLLGMTFVVTLPWLVHQVTTYGLLDPLGTTRHASVVLDQQRFPGLSLTYVVDFATITFHSFWAQFGWMGIVAPDRLYWVYGLWVAIALVGLGRSRCRFNEPAWRLVALTVLAACAALVGYNLTFEQFQGRYLFPAVTAIAALLVAGWAAWLPPSAQRWGVLLAGVTLLILNAYALSRVLVPGFAATG